MDIRDNGNDFVAAYSAEGDDRPPKRLRTKTNPKQWKREGEYDREYRRVAAEDVNRESTEYQFQFGTHDIA